MKYQKLKVSDLNIDNRYQRDIDVGKVKAISKALDWDRLGVPEVSQRADGTYYVVDGQHRVMGVREAGHDGTTIMCAVHEGLTLKQEAALFLAVNGARTAIRAYDKFRAAVTARDPDALDIKKIVESFGLQIQKAQAWNYVCAIQSVEYAHKNNENLADTLSVLTRWEAHQNDRDPSVFERALIRAVSDFLCHYGDNADAAKLVRGMNTQSPNRIISAIRRAQADAILGIGQKWHAAVNVLRGLYNKTTKEKLPPIDAERVAA